MSYRLRDGRAAREWMMEQHRLGTTGWSGMCAKAARSALGVPPVAPSAAAWAALAERHGQLHKGKPEDAPEGSGLLYSGGKYGHAANAGKHKEWCWSTDYERQDHIGRAPRDFPRWHLTYLGWTGWTSYGVQPRE